MNKYIVKILLVVVLIGIVLPIYSQTQVDNLKIISERIIRKGDQLSVSIDVILDEINIQNNDMLILTPTLKSNISNGEVLSFPTIVVTGKLRDKVVARKEKLGNKDELPFENKPQTIIKRKNKTSQSVTYNISTPYEVWMDNASLTLRKTISGCASCSSNAGDQLIVQNVLQNPDRTSYKLTYIVPKAEPMKAKSNRHTVTFNYVVDTYRLSKDYENNSSELVQLDKIIKELKDNENLEITEFSILGYASPEGRFEHNRKLTVNRAHSFVRFLRDQGVPLDKITVEGKGEDWEGLRHIISNSDLENKIETLDIIDKVQNPDARDRYLKRLSNGSTYKTLLRNYYPKLRRTEYTVVYNSKAFDIEEAKQIIKTNPKQLSLNEMFLVAESYPSKSKEFREIFDVIVQLYPDNEVAIVNSAASDIENENYDQAIERLKKIENNPSVWNNLGVAYALKNDMEKASEYFKKSLNSIESEANLRIIERVFESN